MQRDSSGKDTAALSLSFSDYLACHLLLSIGIQNTIDSILVFYFTAAVMMTSASSSTTPPPPSSGVYRRTVLVPSVFSDDDAAARGGGGSVLTTSLSSSSSKIVSIAALPESGKQCSSTKRGRAPSSTSSFFFSGDSSEAKRNQQQVNARLSDEDERVSAKYAYCGTDDGRVLMYQLSKASPASSSVAVLRRTITVHSGKGSVGSNEVSCMVIVRSHPSSLLVVLCGGHISVFDATSLEIHPSGAYFLGKSKGKRRRFSAMCVDESDDERAKLCASDASKSRLRFYVCARSRSAASGSGLEFTHLRDVSIRGLLHIRHLIWKGDRVCVTLNDKHSIVSAVASSSSSHDRKSNSNSGITEIPLMGGSSSGGVILSVPDSCILFSGIERVGVVIDWKGQPSGNTLTWSEPPSRAVLSGSYLVSACNERIDVHAFSKRAAVQRIALPSTCTALGAIDDRGSAEGGPVFIACKEPASLHMLELLPAAGQVESLLAKGQIAEALELAKAQTFPSEKAAREKALISFRADAAIALMGCLDFKRSLEQLELAGADPREILSYLPDVVPPDFAYAPELLRPIAVGSTSLRDLIDAKVSEKAQADAEEKRARDCIASYLEKQGSDARRSERCCEAIDTALILLLCNKLATRTLSASESGVVARRVTEMVADPSKRFSGERVLPSLESAGLSVASATVLASIGKTRRALERLHRVGAGLESDAAGCDGLEQTVDILASSDDPEIVLTNAKRLLVEHPFLALKVFQRNAKAGLPPVEVLSHFDIVQSMEMRSKLRIAFLVHICSSDNMAADHDAQLHTMLATEYIGSVEVKGSLGEIADTARNRSLREALLNHLKTSNRFDVHCVLESAQQRGLLVETVYLHKKLGDHESALRTLLHRCRDFDGAELYCEEQGEGASADLKLLLLNLCLYSSGAGGAADSDMLDFAVSFLCRNVDAMDHVKTLRLVPPETRLFAFEKYLTKLFSSQAHTQRQVMIERSLAKAENLQIKCLAAEERKRYVVVGTETRCSVCKKRILDKVFYVTPDSDTVHYNCAEEAGLTTSQ